MNRGVDCLFSRDYENMLLTLLQIPTVTPLETGRPAPVEQAQACYAAAATALGFDVVLHEPAPSSVLAGPCVPLPILQSAARMGAEFLSSQPNLVLRLGPQRPVERTLMFNFHMDTVSGHVPVQGGARFTGRGAVDMKGPGVALLAGIGEALRVEPTLANEISILIQCVSGEEGGGMGVYGTKALIERGFIGRLNVFAEPSGGSYLDHCTCSMTARVDVEGEGSTDDDPAAGHNATLLLGYIASYLAKHLVEPVEALGGKLCIAGLSTGSMHNRIYGSGSLSLNLAYGSEPAAEVMAHELEAAIAAALEAFTTEFSSVALARRTVRDLAEICRLTWVKRGLPTLANRDEELEELLRDLGIPRDPFRAITCDAIWAQIPGTYTVVYGPGDLARNGAHTDQEFIDRAELESFAAAVATLVCAFRARVRRSIS